MYVIRTFIVPEVQKHLEHCQIPSRIYFEQERNTNWSVTVSKYENTPFQNSGLAHLFMSFMTVKLTSQVSIRSSSTRAVQTRPLYLLFLKTIHK